MLYVKALFFIEVLVVLSLTLFRWALAPQIRKIVSSKLVALAMVTPAIALFCGNIYIFYIYLVVIVAFNSRARNELAAAFLFLLPQMPMLVVETRASGIYLFGFSTLSAMDFGALIAYFITSSRHTLKTYRYDAVIFIITIIFVLSGSREANATGFLRELVMNLLAFIGPYLLISRSSRNGVEVQRLLLALCMGAMLMAVTALFQATRHWVVFELYYDALHVSLKLGSAALALRAGFLRTGGMMIDYSAGGLFLASILTMMPLIRRNFNQVGFWVTITVLSCALIATQSRGAWIAAIIGMVFVAAYRGRWTSVLLVAGGAAAAETLILLYAKSGALAQILGRSEEASGTADYRRKLASQGLDQIVAHPWVGQPAEQLMAHLSNLEQGQHIVDIVNGHLFVAMSAGVPAFLIWCLIWFMPVADGWRRRGDRTDLAAVPAAIIVPAMVALTFTSFIDRNLTWPTVALALAPACFAFRPFDRTSRRNGASAIPLSASTHVAFAR